MKRSFILSLSAPLAFVLVACAPEHATVSPLQARTVTASVNTILHHQDWPKNEWWKAYNDPQLTRLIAKALNDAPDMQIARQRITLAEARQKPRWLPTVRRWIFQRMPNVRKCPPKG